VLFFWNFVEKIPCEFEMNERVRHHLHR